MQLEIAFRLPESRATFTSDYALSTARLVVDGAVAVEAASAASLAAGVTTRLPDARAVTLRATDPTDVRVWIDGVEAPREDRLRAPIARSAWVEAWLALAGSAAGFAASWLYLRRANASGDAWAMKMAVHMAAWHLLLTLTLFPASLWGQRLGVRAVQLAALVFFCIHVALAFANHGATDGPAIALLNAMSGLGFLATLVVGQRAHRDMDPLRGATAST